MVGALNAHAEELYKTLASQKWEQWVKLVMLRLVRTGEGTKDTRQRQQKSDLLEMGKDSVEREAIKAVINALVNGCLLVSDRIENQDVIDLSHEALMRSWKRLVTWREGDREVRRIVDAIEDVRRAWTDKGKKRRDLLEGRLLKDGKRLLKDAPADVFGTKGFIQCSWRLYVLELLLGQGSIMLLLVLIFIHDFRQEGIEYSYEQIERYNGGQRERVAVVDLVQGCYELKTDGNVPKSSRGLKKLFLEIRTLKEAIYGNCRILKDVRLEKAELGDSHLNGADLQGANLSSGYLKSTQLVGVNLQNTNLSGIDLTQANLASANLSGAKFECLKNKEKISGKLRQCPSLKDIKWDENTNWKISKVGKPSKIVLPR